MSPLSQTHPRPRRSEDVRALRRLGVSRVARAALRGMRARYADRVRPLRAGEGGRMTFADWFMVLVFCVGMAFFVRGVVAAIRDERVPK